MLKIKKMKLSEIVLCLIMILGLGFRSSKEVNVSSILIIALTLVMIGNANFKLNVVQALKYILWYSCVVLMCAFSMIWAKVNIWNYVYALFKDTFIPLICFIICVEIYLSNNHTPFDLFNCLIVAEVFVVLRAIFYTPWMEMFQSFDSRLFASGLGRNYNDFTTQMTLVSLILSYMSFYVNKKYKRIFFIFMIFIIITASRKAIIISILGFVIFYLCSSGINIKKLMKRLLIITVILGLLLFVIFHNDFLYSLVGEKLLSMIQSFGLSSSEIRSTISASDIDHSLHGRAVLREEAFKQFIENPILGIGYYNFQYFNRYNLYTHNNYLELLANLGIVGFTLYYCMYFSIFITALRKIMNKQDKQAIFKFVLIYISMLVVMEYAQITFFRLFALVPTIIVFRFCDYYRNIRGGEDINVL